MMKLATLFKTKSVFLSMPQTRAFAGLGSLLSKSNGAGSGKKKDIQQYKGGQLVTRTALVLKKQDDIESFVLNLIKNYFRTTNKSNLTLESDLEKHGLDSLDYMEIAMQIEEELGYVISAETLPVLRKGKHFVNYIQHVEAFKEEYRRAPLA